MSADFQRFCGSPLWEPFPEESNTTVNSSSTAGSEGLIFTECFQNTILVWVPCGYLAIVAPIYFWHLVNSNNNVIRLNWINICKLACGVGLLVLLLASLFQRVHIHHRGEPLYPATLLAPAVNFVTMALATILIEFGRKKGVRVSGVLFTYWLMQTVAGALTLQSTIKIYMTQGSGIYDVVHSSLFVLLVFVEFIFSCMVDHSPYSDVLAQQSFELPPCAEYSVSILSVITFWWFTSLIVLGYKRSLEKSDLWSLNPDDMSKRVTPKFEHQWKKEVDKMHRSKQKLAAQQPETDIPLTSPHEKAPEVTVKSGKNVYKPSLGVALAKAYGATFLVGSALKLVHDILLFVSPVLLRELILFTEDKTQPDWKGYTYAFLLLAVAIVQSMVLHQYFHRCFLTGMRLRTSVIASVYQKSLKLSNAARRISTVGEIVNLMAVDAQRFTELTTYLNMIWSGPFQMCVSLYFLWLTLGPSVLAGVGVMIILIPINAVIAKKNRTLQAEQMIHKDNRIKLMNEVLNGIKVLKLYAWELSFQQKILDIRQKELYVMRKAAFLNAASSFTWTCAPFMVSLTTFAVYVLSDDANILDAQKAFVSLALFNIIRFPLAMLPGMIANLVQVSVSIKRLRTFLLHEELDPDSVERINTGKYAIKVENGSFAWDKNEEKPIVQDLTLDIPEGELVAVVGVVGSGKSSLMSAILGEMDKLHGKVTVKGTVAYTAQQAWIQNATLRDNVLFGRIHDDPEYSNVLEACAMNPDLEILPGGDLTEIGEKGINLSGGQKQRVSLARAVYQDADIYLMDDPLSAVDAHVGKHIFEKVIGPKGLLRGKTRVLVTHGINFLPRMDQILVLVDGCISERGTYRELLNKEGAFANFLKTYLEEHEESDDEDDDEDAALKEEIMCHIHVGSPKDDSVLSNDRVPRIRLDTTRSTTSTDSPHVRNRKETLRSMSNDSVGSNKRQHHGSRTSLKKKDSDWSKEKEALLANGKEHKKDEKLIKEETSATGMVKLSVFLLYLRSMKVIVCVVIFVLYTLNNVLQVGANFWLSAWSNDKLVNGTVDKHLRDIRLGVYGALGFAQGIAVLGGSFVLAFGALYASTHLHRSLLYNVLRSPMHFFDVTPVGRVTNRFSRDMDTVDTRVPHLLEGWINGLFILVETMIVISYSTPFFLAVLVPIAAIYIGAQRFYVATSRQLKRLESVSRSPIYSHFGETIQGTSTIRAFRLQSRFIDDSDNAVDRNQECYYPSIVSNRWLAVRLELVGNLIVLFAALFAVIGRDHLSAGIVGLSISYALNVTQVLNWTVRMTSELETNIVSVERVREYTVTPTEAEWEVTENQPPDNWPASGEVQFTEYSTRYREGLDLVLKDITCKIRPGEKIGIVGRTGAGKSSLTMGLFRIIEAAGGSISIDGVKISDIGLHDVRSKITIIPQDPVLFSGTLRMNLDPFDRHNDDEIWSALEHAHLKTFILSLAEGLQHQCAEGGENLSLGQRQLVCLARALLRKTRILVLDEATAAVDLETDDLIQTTIRTEFKHSTIMTIAHRLNTIMDYDRVMVFKAGRIAEIDTPQTLLNNKCSLFYSMAKDAGLAE